MARGTRSASLRRIGAPEEFAEGHEGMDDIIQRIASYEGRRTVETEEGEQVLKANFPVVESRRRRNYAGEEPYSEVCGVLMRDYLLELDTREGRRTVIALSRATFSFRPGTAVAVYFGASAGADNFASSLAEALFDDSSRFRPVLLSSDELKAIRRRALNIRFVGYRNNPDPNVQKMSYAGTHVDQSPDVKRADKLAELHRIRVEIETTGGRRTIQVMGSGGILGYGTERDEIEDIVDIIEEVLYGS